MQEGLVYIVQTGIIVFKELISQMQSKFLWVTVDARITLIQSSLFLLSLQVVKDRYCVILFDMDQTLWSSHYLPDHWSCMNLYTQITL